MTAAVYELARCPIVLRGEGLAHAPGALPAVVTQVQDVGTHIMLTATVAGHSLKARLSADAAKLAIGDVVWLTLMGEHTCFYKNEEIVP